MAATFTLSGATVAILREGSPGDDVEAAVKAAERTRAGRGWRYTFTISTELANVMADYLWSVAGVVGDITAAEREGGREHKAAAEGVRRIEEALQS